MTQIFISYAHGDVRALEVGFEQLRPLLEHELKLHIWQDISKLRAGSSWHPEIQRGISTSDIFLAIVSPRYLNSGYIRNHELPAISEAREKRSALVIPVMLEACRWQSAFNIFRQVGDITDTSLQGIPSNAKANLLAIRDWKPQTRGWKTTCDALFDAISDYLSSKPRIPETSPGKMEPTPDGYRLEGTITEHTNQITPQAQSLLEDVNQMVDRIAPLCERIGNADSLLSRAIEDYRRQLARDFAQIDLYKLWANGNRLLSRIREIRTEELKEVLDTKVVRQLMGDLNSIADCHSVMMMQTEDGQKLTAQVLTVGQLPGRTRKVRAARSKPVLDGLVKRENLFEPETRALIKSVGDALERNSDANTVVNADHLGTLSLASFGKLIDPVAEKAIQTGIPADPDAINAEFPLKELTAKTLETVRSLSKEVRTFTSGREELRRYFKWLEKGLEAKAPRKLERSRPDTKKSLQSAWSEFLGSLHEIAGDIRGRMTRGAPMDRVTWFRAGGLAELMFQPHDVDDLIAFLNILPDEIPLTVVGVGSNILVRDGGIPGVVLRLSAKGFGSVELAGENRIIAGAICPDKHIAAMAMDKGIGGFHFYYGIPGSAGGAARMNAAANGVETRDRVVEVHAVDRKGNKRVLSNAEMGYTYRHSSAPDDLIFTHVVFEGYPEDRAKIRAEMDEVRSHRETVQPVREKTGGSTFKNPEGHSAWKLIDEAGCRGLVIGGAQMSSLHCNFMINMGQATGYDLEYLGEQVRREVFEKSGIKLEWEIKRLGAFEPNKAILPFHGVATDG